MRVPVDITADERGARPPRVAVPAFLTLELRLRNRGERPLAVGLPDGRRLTVAAGSTRRVRLEGRRPGRYVVRVGPAGRVVLDVGAEPGP